MLNIYYSNKLEALALQLSAQLSVEPLSPLSTESIVVESSAMAQWLTQQMTRAVRHCCKPKVPFPGKFGLANIPPTNARVTQGLAL